MELNIPSNSLICKIINWVFILFDHTLPIFWFYISLACPFFPLMLILLFGSLFYFIFCFPLLLSLLFLCVDYHWNHCYQYSPSLWPFALRVFHPAKLPLWIDITVADSGADWSKGVSPAKQTGKLTSLITFGITALPYTNSSSLLTFNWGISFLQSLHRKIKRPSDENSLYFPLCRPQTYSFLEPG